jgi:hypothetical protein
MAKLYLLPIKYDEIVNEEAQGLVFLLNHAQEFINWVDKIANHDIEIKLIYDISDTQDKELEQNCWDSGFEFVAANNISRVVEALEAHVWPDLQLKRNKSRRSPNAGDTFADEIDSPANEEWISRDDNGIELNPNIFGEIGKLDNFEKALLEIKRIKGESFNLQR